MTISSKHERFINEYLVGFNGTDAYIAVYGPVKRTTAAANAARLLALPSIRQAVRNRLNESSMIADEVLRRLAAIARGQNGAEVRDQIAALHLIGKHHKLFTEKTEVSGPNGGPIEYKEDDQASKRILDKLNTLQRRLIEANGHENNQE